MFTFDEIAHQGKEMNSAQCKWIHLTKAERGWAGFHTAEAVGIPGLYRPNLTVGCARP